MVWPLLSTGRVQQTRHHPSSLLSEVLTQSRQGSLPHNHDGSDSLRVLPSDASTLETATSSQPDGIHLDSAVSEESLAPSELMQSIGVTFLTPPYC